MAARGWWQLVAHPCLHLSWRLFPTSLTLQILVASLPQAALTSLHFVLSGAQALDASSHHSL